MLKGGGGGGTFWEVEVLDIQVPIIITGEVPKFYPVLRGGGGGVQHISDP